MVPASPGPTLLIGGQLLDFYLIRGNYGHDAHTRFRLYTLVHVLNLRHVFA